MSVTCKLDGKCSAFSQSKSIFWMHFALSCSCLPPGTMHLPETQFLLESITESASNEWRQRIPIVTHLASNLTRSPNGG